MTAKDRAREVHDRFANTDSDEEDITIIEQALQSERSAGRAEAFEESAKEADYYAANSQTARQIAAAIRELPEQGA